MISYNVKPPFRFRRKYVNIKKPACFETRLGETSNRVKQLTVNKHHKINKRYYYSGTLITKSKSICMLMINM